MGKISIYLNQLKNQAGYTQQQLSDITGIPLGTIPRYFGAMEDEAANFEIVRKLVVAMRGSLDELAGIAPKQLEISEEKLTEDGYTESEIKGSFAGRAVRFPEAIRQSWQGWKHGLLKRTKGLNIAVDLWRLSIAVRRRKFCTNASGHLSVWLLPSRRSELWQGCSS